MAHNKKLLTI